jgi:hypothetical protein
MRLTHAIRDNLVHIENEADEALVEKIHRLQRLLAPKEGIFPVLSYRNPDLLERERRASQLVNQMEADEKRDLQAQLAKGFGVLERYGLPDGPWQAPSSTGTLASIAALALGAVPAVLGYLFAFVPSQLSRWIQRTKVKKNTFLAPVLLAANLGFFLLYYILWAILSLALGSWEVFLGALILGVFGYGSILWKENLHKLLKKNTLRQLKSEEKEEIGRNIEAMQEALERLKKG